MISVKLQWRRNESGSLVLWVFEGNDWVYYKSAKHYCKDAPISSDSGFATAQTYLKLAKDNKIQLDYLPTLEV